MAKSGYFSRGGVRIYCASPHDNLGYWASSSIAEGDFNWLDALLFAASQAVKSNKKRAIYVCKRR